MRCAYECEQDLACKSFNYNGSSKKCLLKKVLITDMTKLERHLKIEYYIPVSCKSDSQGESISDLFCFLQLLYDSITNKYSISV